MDLVYLPERLPGTAAVPKPLILSSTDDGLPRRSERSLSRKYDGVGTRKAHRILMMGRQRELALYRAEVLRHYGFLVSIPTTEAEALAVIERGDFDIAVLSYTLPDSAVQQIAEAVRERCPECPIVTIVQTLRTDRRIAPDAVVLADNGPDELLAALHKVMQTRDS